MKLLPKYARKPLLVLLVIILMVQFYTIVLESVVHDATIRTVAVIGLSILTWIPLARLLPLESDDEDELLE